MKYILNETPVRTSNNFRINNITLDLNIEEKELSKLDVKGIEYKSSIKDGFNSKINLHHTKYFSLDIGSANPLTSIPTASSSDKPLLIK